MRGSDTQQSAMFSYLSPEQRVPAGHPLRRVREITDRLLVDLSDLFDQMYSTMGRPSIAPEKLLRALLLQVLYTIRSERMLIEQLGNSSRPAKVASQKSLRILGLSWISREKPGSLYV
jgi:transposase